MCRPSVAHLESDTECDRTQFPLSTAGDLALCQEVGGWQNESMRVAQ